MDQPAILRNGGDNFPQMKQKSRWHSVPAAILYFCGRELVVATRIRQAVVDIVADVENGQKQAANHIGNQEANAASDHDIKKLRHTFAELDTKLAKESAADFTIIVEARYDAISNGCEIRDVKNCPECIDNEKLHLDSPCALVVLTLLTRKLALVCQMDQAISCARRAGSF